METKMTWKAIQKEYPQEWISVVEPKFIEGQGIREAIVIAHAKTKNALINKTKKLMEEGLEFSKHMIVFTGEIPYIVGLGKLEITNVYS